MSRRGRPGIQAQCSRADGVGIRTERCWPDRPATQRVIPQTRRVGAKQAWPWKPYVKPGGGGVSDLSPLSSHYVSSHTRPLSRTCLSVWRDAVTPGCSHCDGASRGLWGCTACKRAVVASAVGQISLDPFGSLSEYTIELLWCFFPFHSAAASNMTMVWGRNICE